MLKRVALTVKAGQSAAVAAVLSRMIATLRRHGLETSLDAEAAKLAGAKSAGRLDEIVVGADLLVVLGGDGSVLAAVRAIGALRVPVLGVNLGHLGFLTDVAPEEAEAALEATLRGEYTLLERSRLEVSHRRAGAELSRELVLNDAVIAKGAAPARLIELEASLGERVISTYRADGLIVSTPTGSTAYNLSAGGPIVDPEVRAAILNPICPHTLTQRPLVLPDDVEINVRLCSQEEAALTLDGQVLATLQKDDVVRVVKAAEPARFVATSSHDSFDTLRTKLGWGSR